MGGNEDAINSEDYMTELDLALSRHGLSADKIILTDELTDPLAPFRVASCYKIKGEILLKRRITREEQRSVIDALSEFDPRAEKLSDDLTFLKHAVLHEACHILWRYKNCDECDAWAFYEMLI